MGVGKRGNRVTMQVSLRLLLGIDLDNDYYKGLEWGLVVDGTWW